MASARADLYERELANFRQALKDDPKGAMDRFGMAMIHSLGPEERAGALKSLGLEPAISAEDHYNLGVAAARAATWDTAIAAFKEALKKRPEMREAAFNLALSCERAGMTRQAVAGWQGYLDLLDSGEEATSIKKHITELGKG